MKILIWTIIVVIGWVLLGSFVLSSIDKNLELTRWKMQAPVLLIFIVNMLWPIVALFYISKRR